MARTAWALTLGLVLTACGRGVVPEVGPAASGPGGPTASTSPCRPPLAEDAAGEVVVMLTPPEPGADGLAGADEHAILEDFRDGSPHPEAIVRMQAAYTHAELLDLTDRAIRLLDGPLSGGPDTIRNRVRIEVETDPAQAREALGELADHPALELSVPEYAEVLPPPEAAVSPRGTGSNCGGMLALGTGTLSGGHVGGAGDEACGTGGGSDVFLVNGLTVVEPAG